MRASDGDWEHLSGRIVDGVHRLPIRIYYEDTDFTGLVYHASYLRFMERGRSDFIRLLGIDQGELFEQTAKEAPGFHFVVRSMKLDFLKPARVDDVIEVVTQSGRGRRRIDRAQAERRARRRDADRSRRADRVRRR